MHGGNLLLANPKLLRSEGHKRLGQTKTYYLASATHVGKNIMSSKAREVLLTLNDEL